MKNNHNYILSNGIVVHNSGKGFAITNFLEGDKFKVRDVDEWKKALLKISELKNKYPEIRGLNLRKGQDVFKLHKFVKSLGIKEKTLENLLRDVKEDRLPNIVFDITLKDIKDITKVLPQLVEVGYEPKNINLVWVLTNYYVAVERNKTRERVVADDILLFTHEGAAKTMFEVIRGNIPKGVDGGIYVILNNKENTIPYVDADGKPLKTKGGSIKVKDFTYVTIKKAGKKLNKESDVQKQVYDWIVKNVPKTALTKEMGV